MNAYKALRDISNNFENELRQISSQLFCSKVGENFEDAVANKMRVKTLYSSKLKLLRAVPLSLTPHVREQSQDNLLQQYKETVQWKLIEQLTVKSLTQSHAVKALITAPNKNLSPELIKRKEDIVQSLSQYEQKESELHDLETILREKEAEQELLRNEWDQIVGNLKDTILDRDQRVSNNPENRGPHYLTMKKVVDKLELMRWLIERLVCARSGPGRYDWLADPHQRLTVLALTRAHNTIDMFTQDDSM